MNYIIQTERLGLRNWHSSDLEAFVKMGQDTEVMKHFPSLLSPSETEQLMNRFSTHFYEKGYTYFAVDELSTGKFIGFTGLMYQTFESDFTPSVDIGWRFKREAWGKGYATEAAKACLEFGFNKCKLAEIYSHTPVQNKPSEKVMQRIGMEYIKTFLHPKLDKDSPLNPCVLYRSIPHGR
ncbi:GNAT family N-acetyltransferase [Luteirhabdus pelagi]|uniref:GNAT family N-acetyltransferase n=1 Tax=Luteirhabdus pelagi TaxID=2792783 RepID=UPI001939DD19|nr:GNAT family N-acetyltransferase [Luteirhabdus pelagi]